MSDALRAFRTLSQRAPSAPPFGKGVYRKRPLDLIGKVAAFAKAWIVRETARRLL